ncbi:hypothetical protein [uncultured Friedmanniella sp.]|uniref:hypothetical protein n=1 Tax=uncultured Friedmanniella sp. TaxID=335381 RepID=UPI0035CC7B90
MHIASLSPALPLILVRLYDASTAELGWVLGVYHASGFVSSMLVPAYADRHHDDLRRSSAVQCSPWCRRCSSGSPRRCRWPRSPY